MCLYHLKSPSRFSLGQRSNHTRKWSISQLMFHRSHLIQYQIQYHQKLLEKNQGKYHLEGQKGSRTPHGAIQGIQAYKVTTDGVKKVPSSPKAIPAIELKNSPWVSATKSSKLKDTHDSIRVYHAR